jgi:hypothetical protein
VENNIYTVHGCTRDCIRLIKELRARIEDHTASIAQLHFYHHDNQYGDVFILYSRVCGEKIIDFISYSSKTMVHVVQLPGN